MSWRTYFHGSEWAALGLGVWLAAAPCLLAQQPMRNLNGARPAAPFNPNGVPLFQQTLFADPNLKVNAIPNQVFNPNINPNRGPNPALGFNPMANFNSFPNTLPGFNPYFSPGVNPGFSPIVNPAWNPAYNPFAGVAGWSPLNSYYLGNPYLGLQNPYLGMLNPYGYGAPVVSQYNFFVQPAPLGLNGTPALPQANPFVPWQGPMNPNQNPFQMGQLLPN